MTASRTKGYLVLPIRMREGEDHFEVAYLTPMLLDPLETTLENAMSKMKLSHALSR